MCWRLARQLVHEHHARVALVIDAPHVLAAIAPGALPGAVVDGVALELWPGSLAQPGPDDVVISAFGCELPGSVRAALAPSRAGQAPGARLWVNLEYLSAESWVEGCHGLASRKPDDGAIEHFFYPGFTDATGGLLREGNLLAERDSWRAESTNRDPRRAATTERGAGLAGGADSEATRAAARPRRISLFCYPDAPVRALLEMIRAGETPTTVLVPVGVAEPEIGAVAGALPAPGTAVALGSLRIERFSLLPQADYDRLLWSCDLNFVRGEDSWVRAIWAGRPFVWQPYPQQEAAHLAKLEAFLARFEASAGAAAREAGPMMRAWSGTAALEHSWPNFEATLDRTAGAYARFCDALVAGTDLATKLAEFCRVRL